MAFKHEAPTAAGPSVDADPSAKRPPALAEKAEVLNGFGPYADIQAKLLENAKDLESAEAEVATAKQEARDKNSQIGELEGWLVELEAELEVAGPEDREWLEGQIETSRKSLDDAFGAYTPLGNAKWRLRQAQRREDDLKRDLEDAVALAKKEHQPYIEALAKLKAIEREIDSTAKPQPNDGSEDLSARAA